MERYRKMCASPQLNKKIVMGVYNGAKLIKELYELEMNRKYDKCRNNFFESTERAESNDVD